MYNRKKAARNSINEIKMGEIKICLVVLASRKGGKRRRRHLLRAMFIVTHSA